MKRKIAAILAADVVGYSKLVAEDEEETLRRLASYRAVVDDFIEKANGRIFNTAGDAVLAEFSSAVEAVRCAIDIQESLRTRNMAYPPSRQMSFRMGITIGDVVERDGDLLGDGVNIAARLEGLAAPGGICISRTVYEQVANKLSVQFADIGAQEVKNIPNPVHAYMVALRAEDAYADARLRKKKKPGARLLVPALAVTVIVISAGVGGFYYFERASSKPPAVAAALPAPAPAPAPGAPAQKAATAVFCFTAGLAAGRSTCAGLDPFPADTQRAQIRDDYVSGPDTKALALAVGRFFGYVTGQPNEELAQDHCARHLPEARRRGQGQPQVRYLRRRQQGGLYARAPADAAGAVCQRKTLWSNGRSLPRKSLSCATPRRPTSKRTISPARKSKTIALGPSGGYFYYFGHDSQDEVVRRALEICGSNAGTPCLILAVDDNFVVPVPKTMKAVGFFRPATNSFVAANERDFLARRYASSTKGWNAVAASLNGKTGAALGADTEEAAVKTALADCAKVDRECRIIAIGPFSVEPL